MFGNKNAIHNVFCKTQLVLKDMPQPPNPMGHLGPYNINTLSLILSESSQEEESLESCSGSVPMARSEGSLSAGLAVTYQRYTKN